VASTLAMRRASSLTLYIEPFSARKFNVASHQRRPPALLAWGLPQ
jgi:hypothetical protein